MYQKDYLKNILRRFLKDYQTREAFALYDGKNVYSVSFGKFGRDILSIMGYFQEKKITGKHIAIAAENSYKWYVAFFAVLASGNVAVLLNQNLTEEELIIQCDFADVRYILGGKEIREKSVDGTALKWLEWEMMSNAPLPKLNEVDCPEERKLSCLLFTSGTLGSNKAVMLSAGNMEICMSDVMDKFNVRRTLLLLPLYHISGIGGTLYILSAGNTVCIGRGLKYLYQDLAVLNPDHLSMVPGIMDSMVKILKRCQKLEKRKEYIGTRLKYLGVGGASSSERVLRYLLEEGFELSTGYALSETTGNGMMGWVLKDKLKSIGRPMEGIECRIVDGEILLSGRAVMLGYYKDPEATEKAIQNGWLHTGDLGYQDEDGWYYLTGRKKNVIILSNGENVSPEQLEELLYRCKYILECMVYSVRKGICADVYTLEQSAVASYIREYNRNVPTYHQIFRVNYYNTPLEKTGSGKIKRKENRYE